MSRSTGHPSPRRDPTNTDLATAVQTVTRGLVVPHGFTLAVSGKFRLGESAWGAVPGLLPVRFPRPLAEPAVRLSTQRALHGLCLQTSHELSWDIPHFRGGMSYEE